MYSIHVTNKTPVQVYIRLEQEKLSTMSPRFYLDLNELKSGKTREILHSYLVQSGFIVIPSRQTVPFPVDVANDGSRRNMYASLCDWYGSLWTMDFVMDCMQCRCLFVRSKRLLDQIQMTSYHLLPANPVPMWIPAVQQGSCTLPSIVTVGPQGIFFNSGSPSGFNGCSSMAVVLRNNVQYGSLVLVDTGHEFIRAYTGDPLPPHAVAVSVSEPEGSLYLGRVGVNMACTISTEGGKIKSFCCESGKFQSGEILVLTNDST